MQSGKNSRRVAFLVQLPRNVSPGQRFRIEQFEPLLQAHHFSLRTFPFIGTRTYKIYYKQGFLLQKAFGVIMGFLKRFLFLFQALRYDYIFLQREAAPVGPPVYEWVLARLLGKKIILDFDDAIWIADTSENKHLMQWAKCFWKVKYICRWSYKVCVGNSYLANWAGRYNKQVVMIPTCVDTQHRYSVLKQHTEKKVTIGWTGSHSTLRYLDKIYPVLKSLEETYKFRTLIICNHPPGFSLGSLQFLPWKTDTEINDLLQIDIGIMPLEPDAWSEGKCGFKLIQYLALGIPAVASPVGVNKEIIDDDNGFLCATQEEWKHALITLLNDVHLRAAMGRSGRQKMIDRYSIQANAGAFLDLFD